jgi:hypothetical protein
MRLILLASVSLALAAQPFSDRYAPLIRALTLTDAQIAQLQQNSPAPAKPTPPPPLRDATLDAAQRARLAEIDKEYNDLHMRAGAIVMGLLDKSKWGGGFLCYYPVFVYAKAFDLTDAQVQELSFGGRPATVVLNDAQKAKVAAFEADLELGREAVELHLIATPNWGEVLCH